MSDGQTSIRWRFWRTVAFALVGGLGLTVISALHLSKVESSQRQAVALMFENVRPGFSVVEMERVSKIVDSFSSALSRETILDALVRDIGIALIVAALITIALEHYARTRLQDEIRTGVIEAAFARLIPTGVFDEVRETIMSANVVKRDWRVEMYLYRASDELAGDGVYFSHTNISYTLFSVAQGPSREGVGCSLDEALVAQDHNGPVPRINRVVIGQQTYDSAEIEKNCGNSNRRTFLMDAVIERSGTSVHLDITEVLKVPGVFVWNSRQVAEGFRCSIDSSQLADVEFSIEALHPIKDRLHETVRGAKWEFIGALLPYQGFQVTATPKVRALAPLAMVDV
jgi:hypothetical protein